MGKIAGWKKVKDNKYGAIWRHARASRYSGGGQVEVDRIEKGYYETRFYPFKGKLQSRTDVTKAGALKQAARYMRRHPNG